MKTNELFVLNLSLGLGYMVRDKTVEAAEGRTAHNNGWNGANGMASNTWKPWKPCV
jgi:hypothetical protein